MLEVIATGKTLWDFYLRGEFILVEDGVFISEEKCVGKIIVTHVPSPDIVLYMKNALAVVTETGGVLCHAAVLALELGCPIIVAAEGVCEKLYGRNIIELEGKNGEGVVYAERTV